MSEMGPLSAAKALDLAILETRARAGAPEGLGTYATGEDDGVKTLELAFITRPQVAMPYLEGIPYIVSLGVRPALQKFVEKPIQVIWPYGLSAEHRQVLFVTVHVGFGEGGIFAMVQLSVTLSSNTDTVETLADAGLKEPLDTDALAEALRTSTFVELKVWEERLPHGGAGFLAPVLEDYFDALDSIGENVALLYPTGKLKAQGRFAGVDIWGHASVVTPEGKELVVSQAEARIKRL